MITFNTERGLEHVADWKDVLALANFVPELDPTTAKLDTIIASYLMPEEVRCGLSNCHQPHLRGYVVKATDGRLTNLGKDCGKRHFSVEFEAMRKVFDKAILQSKQREQLNAMKNRLDSIDAEIATLRAGPRGIDWLHKKTSALLLRTELPNHIVTTLTKMVRDRSPSLVRERAATQAEAEAIATTRSADAQARERQRRDYDDDDEGRQRVRYVAEEYGQLDGLAALYPEHDLRALYLSLTSFSKDLRALDVDSVHVLELPALAKRAEEVDGELNRLRASVAAANRLLEPTNIGQLAELARTPDDERAVAKFVRTLKT